MIPKEIQYPIVYTTPRFARYFYLSFGVAVILYTVFFLFTQINAETTSVLKKVIPFIVLFFSINLISTNITSLYKISIYADFIQFSYLAKKKIVIYWKNATKLEACTSRGKSFVIHYIENEKEKQYYIPMGFNNIIDVVNLIKYLAPHIQTDEFVTTLIFLPKEKNGV
jgi:hypothetical protein